MLVLLAILLLLFIVSFIVTGKWLGAVITLAGIMVLWLLAIHRRRRRNP